MSEQGKGKIKAKKKQKGILDLFGIWQHSTHIYYYKEFNSDYSMTRNRPAAQDLGLLFFTWSIVNNLEIKGGKYQETLQNTNLRH